MRRSAVLVIVTMALGLNFPASGLAQEPANAMFCPQQGMEPEKQWYERCTAIMNSQVEQPFEMAKLRASLERQPPMPAARNRLLGRWQQPARPRNSSNDLIGQLSRAFSNGGCDVLFGDGSVEFRADRWILTDSDGTTDLGSVTYREGKDNTIFVLPENGAQLLPMKMEGNDRWSMITAVPCIMVRAGTTATQAAPSSAPPTRTAPAAATRALAVGPDAGGYSCPDGRKLYVKSCFNESPAADCGVVNMHLPLSGGFQVETLETRADLLASVAQCKVQPLQFRDGIVSLMEPKP